MLNFHGMMWKVAVPGGEVPVIADDEVQPVVVILAHGAGSHMEQKTVEWLAGLVREAGASVVRFNFLYRAQGRSMPDRMPVLIQTYREVVKSVRGQLSPTKLVVGGHSMGGRAASMMEAEERGADGLLLFGYPLHPAEQPQKLRDAHLTKISTPTLQLNGTEDLLCTQEIMDSVVATLDPSVWHLTWIDGADHSYGVKKASGRTRSDVAEQMTNTISGWLPHSG